MARRIAIVEDGALEELYIERASQDNYVGNIYKGRIVNLEVDVIARYLERLMQGDAAAVATGGGLSMDTLAENGFLGDVSKGLGKQ